MSLPMKGLAKIRTDLVDLQRKFKTFSARCDHSEVGRLVACCGHKDYDSRNHPSFLCLFNCCPVVQDKEG